MTVFLEAVKMYRPKAESRPIATCAGRVLAENVTARQDLPSSDRSVVDGFAIRSVDVQSASASNPVVIHVIGESRLGEGCSLIVGDLEAVSVATGSTVPEGADSVVPVEDVSQMARSQISLTSPVAEGLNIIRKGEDFSRGQVVLEQGRRLRPQDLGALKLLGFAKVRVARRPRVGVMSTGSELVEKNGRRSRRKVVDVNRLILSTMVAECGGEPVDLGIVKDDRRSILGALRNGLRFCDLILVSGGSSVGQRDLVPGCINSLGRPGMMVHGVAMRPSMPTGLAVVNCVPIISLPGFPVSAVFAFRVFGRPMISKLLGARDVEEGRLQAVLSETVRGLSGYRSFVRVRLRVREGGLVAEPLKIQKSSALASMVDADAYVVIPEGVNEILADERVEVTLLK